MTNARRLILAIALCTCTAASVLASAGASAQAAAPRNVIGAFGPGGPGVGVFSDPQSIAVEQSSHDVYVYDVGFEGGTIYKFDSAGAPVDFSALGTNAIEHVGEVGADEGEIAVDDSGGPDSGDIYFASGESGADNVLIYNAAGEPAGEISEEAGVPWGEPCGVAVDSAGDVYVGLYSEHVNKYTPTSGTVSNADYISSLSGLEGVCNIAADSAGDVYVADYSDGPVTKYQASEFNTKEMPPLFGAEVDTEGGTLAVDPTSGHVYIDELSDIAEYKPSGTRVESFGELSESYGVAERHESGDVYAADGEASEVIIFGPGAVVPEVSVGPVSEPHGTSVTLNGTVNPEETSVTACVFEYGTSTSYGLSKPCSKAVPFTGNSAEPVSAGVAGLQSGTVYYFRLTATNSSGTEESAGSFTTPGPTIAEESVANVSSTSAELQAQIDPRGAETSYYFEYGPTTSYGTTVPVPPGVDIGAGTTDQSVAQPAQGLAPGTYHYRVVAVQGAEVLPGLDHTFTTLAQAVAGLPDGRAWELVSPPNKDGAEPDPITEGGGLIQASADGEAISYVADGPMPAEAQIEGSRSPEVTQVLSTRGLQGWVSQDMTTANSRGTGFGLGNVPEYQFFSSDLALALVDPFPGASGSGSLEEPPLAPPLSAGEASHQEKTLYLRDDAPLAPEASEAASYEAAARNGDLMQNPGFLALVTEVNAPGGEAFGGGIGEHSEGLEFEGASSDLSHAVFGSYKAAPGLYEWGPEGRVQPVSVLPSEGGKAGALVNADQAGLGLEAKGARNVRDAVSNDGRLVFWTYDEHLYARDTETGETLQLDTLQGGSGAGIANAVFQTASADGSKVFFTDEQVLTAGSKAEENKPDLYVTELSGGAGPGSPLVGRLTDLTPSGVNGESADIPSGYNGVLGASEDGSYVYFVADGALTGAAPVGDCAREGKVSPPGATCNLYVRHYDGMGWASAKLIAVLSSEDQPDWGYSEGPVNLAFMTSRVSPDGKYLAFMSDRSLTGYDNVDVDEATGRHSDEEVFLYDAGSEHLVCASCNPSGTRPAGVFDPGRGVSGEEGLGLVVDRRGIWQDRWLAGSIPGWTELGIGPVASALYQSRYLSDSGRLFFNSPDHLVAASTSGKEKVYEYEANGVGGCGSESECVGLISSPNAEHEAAFLDASANGNDVFFLTAEKLVPQDVDGLFDVYDARVCEASSPCLSALSGGSPACEETPALPCKGPRSFSPSFATPGSATPSSEGNVVQLGGAPPAKTAKPTRAQQLAKALKQCKKLTRKQKRVACEKRAHKQYGPKKIKQKKKKKRTGKGSGKGRAR